MRKISGIYRITGTYTGNRLTGLQIHSTVSGALMSNCGMKDGEPFFPTGYLLPDFILQEATTLLKQHYNQIPPEEE